MGFSLFFVVKYVYQWKETSIDTSYVIGVEPSFIVTTVVKIVFWQVKKKLSK